LSKERNAPAFQENLIATPNTATPVEIRSFEQLVDHFDARSTITFNQTYFIDWGSVDPVSNHSQTPVFLIVGGEFPLSDESVAHNEASTLAKRHGAILFALEHRYYGSSMVANFTKEGLKYLTTEQALADISNFQQAQRAKGFTGPWFAMGCSYGGVLAAWFRLKYPHQTIAALAASSPIEAILSFDQFDVLVAQAAGPECARSLRVATEAVEKALISDKNHTLSLFECQDVENSVDFLYVIADVVAYGIQMNSQHHYKDQMCFNFTSLPPLQAYTTYTRFLFNHTNTKCSEWSLSSFTHTQPKPGDYMRPWLWQTCTELGYFQTAPPHHSLRSTNITIAYHLDVCRRLFDFPTVRSPIVKLINAEYGGANNFTSSNVIFSNGADDPWRALSVTQPLGPTVPAVVIDGQAHCSNWFRAKDTDSPSLRRGRELVSSYVQYFLNPRSICGKCKNDAQCEVSPEGKNATRVAARCVCLEGWVGPDCSKNVYVTAGLYIMIITSGCALLFALIGIVVGRKLAFRKVAADARSLLER